MKTLELDFVESSTLISSLSLLLNNLDALELFGKKGNTYDALRFNLEHLLDKVVSTPDK